MKNKAYLIFFLGWIIPLFIQAQNKGFSFDKKQKANYTAYPSPNDFRQGGWLFDAGLTGTFGVFAPKERTIGDTTTSYPMQLRPGITLAFGGYFNPKKGRNIIRYMDATLGYKMLWNAENESKEISTGNVTSTISDNLGHYATLNLNFNNVINVSNYNFIQNTLGVNLDYRFIETSKNQSSTVTPSPPSFVAQVHYKLAFGIMVDTDIAVIPYIEVPVFNITPSQNNFAQLDYFNQSYQTVIIGVRVMLFRYGQKDCPKAINYEGKAKNNGY